MLDNCGYGTKYLDYLHIFVALECYSIIKFNETGVTVSVGICSIWCIEVVKPYRQKALCSSEK